MTKPSSRAENTMDSSDSVRPRVVGLLNQMFLSPAEFCFRWGLDYGELAAICQVSRSTAYHWLGGQTSRREAGESYQRLMAIADFILENASRLEPLLENWLKRRQGNIT
jgi:hypothetical protein